MSELTPHSLLTGLMVLNAPLPHALEDTPPFLAVATPRTPFAVLYLAEPRPCHRIHRVPSYTSQHTAQKPVSLHYFSAHAQA
jgi:hypothetical protein